jgi:flagellar hook protein FlgE
MLDAIYIGLTGMNGYATGLNVISNNVANLNSPGFKGAQLQFSDLYYKDAEGAMGTGVPSQIGNGLQAGGTFLNFQQGEGRDTGNDMDVMIEGAGLFVLRKDDGLVYARAGQFQIDDEGVLVDRGSGGRVVALSPGGGLSDITVNGLRFSAAQSTSRVGLSGNLSAGDSQHVIGTLTVFDQGGGPRQLKLTFDQTDTVTHTWKVTVALPDDTAVATGELRFGDDGKPVAGFDRIQVVGQPAGSGPLNFTLMLTSDATGGVGGTDSSLQVQSVDGRATGTLVKTTFDAEGYFTMGYSNGQTERHGRLAMAWFNSPDQLEQLGNNLFAFRHGVDPQLGHASTAGFGKLKGGSVEMSNVDLAKQFSELIVTQRGYQACSQALTTANEMLQMLMDLRGKR